MPGLPLGTRGGMLVPHHFTQSGEYEVRILLARDRNEKIEGMRGTHNMEVLLDGDTKASIELKPPKDSKDHTTYDRDLKARFKVEAGRHELGVTFVDRVLAMQEGVRQPYEANFNYHRHPRRSPAVYQVTIVGPFKADTDDTELTSAEARAQINSLLRRANRRPVVKADVDRIMTFYEEGGMEAAMSAILVSRGFLFHVEQTPEDAKPNETYELSDVELASRLSFFIWSSLPDEELLQLAEQRKLRDPNTLAEQAKRMLADERATRLVSNFANQWLYLRNLESITPDARLFPDFDDNLRQAFQRETELLFESVVTEDRSVLDLITPGETWLNERLARHYGVPHVVGSRWRRVSMDDDGQRGGLLRQGSVLTVSSYATRTSPVLRGNWVLENLLGTPPPPPPPDVPALEDNDVDANLPIRERLAAHREQVACASCHDVIDPIGFAMEHFDAVGAWRDREQGKPVDAKAGMADGRSFVGVDGLEKALLERPDIYVRTLTEKLMTFALARGVESHDAPAIRKIVRDAAKDDYRFSSIVAGIAKSVPFKMRTRR